MLTWKVCIAIAGRSLRAGRSSMAPWETPRVGARASPPRRPPGWTPASPPLNTQDPPNHLSHIPNGFESNVFCPCVLWFCVPPVVLLLDPVWVSSVMLTEMRCLPRRRCVGAQGFVASGTVQRWGGGFPLEVPPGVPPGFRPEVSSEVPQRFPQSHTGAPPGDSQGCPPGYPQGLLQGSPLDSLP
jgi:hypothetical protein